MKKLICLIAFVFCSLICSPVAAESVGAGISRLSTLLNSEQFCNYLYVKEYLTLEDVKNGKLFRIDFADCKLEDDKAIITLYFDSNPRNETIDNNVDGRIAAAKEIYRVMTLLYLEFVPCMPFYTFSGPNTFTCEMKQPYEMRLIAKSLRVLESQGNTLFIWDNGEVEYFPRFFDESL